MARGCRSLTLNSLSSTPEFQLVCACSRTQATAADLERQRQLAPAIDEQRFLECVHRHRVAPLVLHNLRQHPPGIFPQTLLDELLRQQRRNAFQALAATQELHRLTVALRAAGIVSLPLKGIAVALRYYGNASLRHSGDIDIWVAPQDLPRSLQLLRDVGYAVPDHSKALTAVQQRYLQSVTYHEEYRHPQGHRLELHWRLEGNPHGPVEDIAGIFQRSEPLNIGTLQIPAFGAEDLLLYLCSHGSKHAWFRLKWLFDLPNLLESREWDWPALFAKAERERCLIHLHIGLLLAQQLCGWQAPAPVLAAWEEDRSLQRRAAYCYRALNDPENWWTLRMPMLKEAQRQLGYLRGLHSSWRGRAWLWYRNATCEADWQVLPLPDACFYLYFPLHPLLVLARRLFKLEHGAPGHGH